MTYETAKKLQDAGYPQQPRFMQQISVNNENVNEFVQNAVGRCCFHFPTLSELIEACGGGSLKIERFVHVTRGIIWEARIRGTQVSGQTLEEALAELWLALNKTK